MSSWTYESMINNHGSGVLADLRESCTSGGSTSGVSWPNCARVTCTMSGFPGATSLSKPKSRSGGRERRRAGVAS
jgi:hypothetical protein